MQNFLLSLTFVFISTFVFGQTNVEFIETEVSKLEVQLAKNDVHNSLTNVQKEKLHQIFADKYNKVQQVIDKKLAKLATSQAITKIDEELQPKIEAILTLEQRTAIQIKKKSAIKDSKK